LIVAKACFSQADTSFKLIKTFPGQIADAAIDNLDNIYILTETDQLKKYNAAGDSLAVYNNVRRFGKVYSIDVSNPLKVLLYYKDFAGIVILDRLLAVRSTIDLRRKNILQVTAMGQSYDNNIWVFDAFDNKLKKIDEEGNILLETPDFRQALGQAVTPQQIIDQNKQVYLILQMVYMCLTVMELSSEKYRYRVGATLALPINLSLVLAIMLYRPTIFLP
jgi:hypothetical protein